MYNLRSRNVERSIRSSLKKKEKEKKANGGREQRQRTTLICCIHRRRQTGLERTQKPGEAMFCQLLGENISSKWSLTDQRSRDDRKGHSCIVVLSLHNSVSSSSSPCSSSSRFSPAPLPNHLSLRLQFPLLLFPFLLPPLRSMRNFRGKIAPPSS